MRRKKTLVCCRQTRVRRSFVLTAIVVAAICTLYVLFQQLQQVGFRPTFLFNGSAINFWDASDNVCFLDDSVLNFAPYITSDSNITNSGRPPALLSDKAADDWCTREVSNCEPGVPCSYQTTVNLRVIILTYNRPCSLAKTLRSVAALHTLGHSVSVHIWVDVPAATLTSSTDTGKEQDSDSDEGKVVADSDTLRVANAFVKAWSQAGRRACVHVQRAHVHITGQWIDTWQPPTAANELALILEDDIDVSPHAYRWLLAAHSHYGSWANVSGYTLQMENTNFFAPEMRPMSGPPTDAAFAYPVLGTWGFAPRPAAWAAFQRWYHETRSTNASYKPYVEGIVPLRWYHELEDTGREETMWEMWHIHYTYLVRQWCIYPNFAGFTGAANVLLSSNRQEVGLHYAEKGLDNTGNLLHHWDSVFVKFPERLAMYTYDGELCTSSVNCPPNLFAVQTSDADSNLLADDRHVSLLGSLISTLLSWLSVQVTSSHSS